MRQQMFRLLSMMALALVIVYMAVSALYQLYSDPPGEYTISAAQLAEALERGDAPLAQNYPLDAVYFPDDLMARLRSGEIVGLDAGSEQLLFYRLTDNGVLQIGPFPQHRSESITHWRLLLIGAMLVVLMLLLWPMFRDLHELQKRAIRFSERPFRMPANTRPGSAIYSLTETFRRMANIVLDYCQMNQDLARTIAHEVRTPLAQIKFQLALMPPDPDNRLIASSVNSIEQLVDRYLNFARLEIQEKFIARKWINVEDFFGDLASTLESQCPNLKIGYYFPNGQACLEPDSLAIAIQNLVTNANKYADDRVELRFDIGEGRCVLTVEDNGPGLAGDALELTDAFTRSATDEQGYGLGLYIVKKVMMWHDGELRLDRSPKLGGTRATLSWPNYP
ncbi:HAMP domain-containing sensor histidine kinase [Microbulbifer magnicolonia]|uniref:sensor histidine kinase n=1 Tax=Microbulbifer magnicolonia TaxID=3109744 RepID=UPI002B401885|nr:HAMP domain-containing sensor histidine kinase [Microbulbifer sp. GG15]